MALEGDGEGLGGVGGGVERVVGGGRSGEDHVDGSPEEIVPDEAEGRLGGLGVEAVAAADLDIDRVLASAVDGAGLVGEATAGGLVEHGARLPEASQGGAVGFGGRGLGGELAELPRVTIDPIPERGELVRVEVVSNMPGEDLGFEVGHGDMLVTAVVASDLTGRFLEDREPLGLPFLSPGVIPIADPGIEDRVEPLRQRLVRSLRGSRRHPPFDLGDKNLKGPGIGWRERRGRPKASGAGAIGACGGGSAAGQGGHNS